MLFIPIFTSSSKADSLLNQPILLGAIDIFSCSFSFPKLYHKTFSGTCIHPYLGTQQNCIIIEGPKNGLNSGNEKNRTILVRIRSRPTWPLVENYWGSFEGKLQISVVEKLRSANPYRRWKEILTSQTLTQLRKF